MSRLVRLLMLCVTLCLCLVALAYEMRQLVVDYVVPVQSGEIRFIESFQWFYCAAQNFAASAARLYDECPDPHYKGYYLLTMDRRVGYNYPPPSILFYLLLSRLSVANAYVLLLVGNVFAALLIVAAVIAWRGFGIRSLDAWAAALLAVASGPVYANLVFGEINIIVLVLCLAYIGAAQRRRYVLAGFCLAVGCWFKVYPVMLALPALFERGSKRLITSISAWCLAIPILCLPVIPPGLYSEALQIMAATGRQVSLHPMNQSFLGVCMRAFHSSGTYWTWTDILIPSGAWRANVLLAGVLMGGITLLCLCRRIDASMVSVAILAVIPVVTPLGWGSTYVFVMPFLIAWLLDRRGQGLVPQWVKPVLLLLMLPPSHWALPFQAARVDSLDQLFYARYAIVVLVGLADWMLTEWRSLDRGGVKSMNEERCLLAEEGPGCGGSAIARSTVPGT